MSVSRKTSLFFALRVLRMQIGCPADLSDRQPSNFSLFGQRKVTKRKATRSSALILRVSLLARVFGRGFPAPPKTSGIPAAPLRADLSKYPLGHKSCDARGGITG